VSDHAIRTVAIVQARFGSRRLPGKVLRPLAGRPMLAHVLERAAAIPGVDAVCLATSDSPEDTPVARLAESLGFTVFRGALDDVLDRFHGAALATHALVCVRITADCPLLDPYVAGAVVALRASTGADYASNVHPPTFPDGLDCEVFTRSALEIAWREAVTPAQREHVTPFLYGSGDRFLCVNLSRSVARADARLTVDDADDLALADLLLSGVTGPAPLCFAHEPILDRLDALPDSARARGHLRNEGYAMSLDEHPFTHRAHAVIPGGAHTYSRGDDQLPAEAPRGFVSGKGARATDIDGRVWVDWGMGINNVLIGHAEDVIDDAAIAAIRRGQAFTRPTPVEVELAERLVAHFPGMDMIKFAKNGSDPNSAAIRLARAITGRTRVAYDETAPFLAIHDWFIGRTVVNAGVPEAIRALSVPFRLNEPATVDALFDGPDEPPACVILEIARERTPAPGFLEHLRAKCDAHGTLLIFDEVVTGFRYALHGLYSTLGVTPDLLSIGKGMANGYAIAALLGRREYMERGGIRHGHERVFFLSTTNGPEQSALAAAAATLDFYLAHDVIAKLADVGAAVKRGLADAARHHGISDRVGTLGDYDNRPLLDIRGPDGNASFPFRTLFVQEMCRHGVFMPYICPSFRHGPSELDQTFEAFDRACAVQAQALEAGTTDGFLNGPPARPVFRKWN
jgi:glutamate-1-semialdehyde aminotransferase/spore coat polysaccharide biosynthesis protein SpsF (cytidylyltransferase family)